MSSTSSFVSLNIAVLTISDTRSIADDTSGQCLAESLTRAGHQLKAREIVPDDVYQIRAIISQWIASGTIQVIISTGGTGFAGRDSTPEAITPLLDKEITGFGELFRHVSYAEIGTSTMQSRVFAGLANRTVLFCLPGSTGACKTGWSLIQPQLDATHKPCNFVPHVLPIAPCATRG